jgi:hypothetical protein
MLDPLPPETPRLIGCNPGYQDRRSSDCEPSRYRIHLTGSPSALRKQGGNGGNCHRPFEHLKLSSWRRQRSGWTRKHRPPSDQPGNSQQQEYATYDAISDVDAIVSFKCMEACRDCDPNRYKKKHGAGGEQSSSRGVARGKAAKPVLQVAAIRFDQGDKQIRRSLAGAAHGRTVFVEPRNNPPR